MTIHPRNKMMTGGGQPNGSDWYKEFQANVNAIIGKRTPKYPDKITTSICDRNFKYVWWALSEATL